MNQGRLNQSSSPGAPGHQASSLDLEEGQMGRSWAVGSELYQSQE